MMYPRSINDVNHRNVDESDPEDGIDKEEDPVLNAA
jgi:hypothetical protein